MAASVANARLSSRRACSGLVSGLWMAWATVPLNSLARGLAGLAGAASAVMTSRRRTGKATAEARLWAAPSPNAAAQKRTKANAKSATQRRTLPLFLGSSIGPVPLANGPKGPFLGLGGLHVRLPGRLATNGKWLLPPLRVAHQGASHMVSIGNTA